MTEMRCSERLTSDPDSHTPDADCDVAEASKDALTTDPALRRAVSLPDSPPSASQNSPTSPQSLSRQSKAAASSRSSDGGIVAERAKRFSEKSSSIGKTSATRSECTSPSTSSVSSRCSRNDSVESLPYSREPVSVGQPAATETQPHRTAIHQAAPPAEHEPEPEVNFPPSTVVSFPLDECLPSVEQSARVEPSPERMYTLPSCAEEDEATSPLTAASVDKVPVPLSSAETHADKTAQKLRTFFGDDNILPDQLQHSGELADDSFVEAETKKNGGVKAPDTSRGKKTWALATVAPKAGGIHSPGPRQRRSPSDKEMLSSVKQKEHKTPGAGASPPTQTSRDKVAPANAGSQAATWKDKVNPFKRHGSGSTLSAVDQAGTSSSASAAVTGAFGVPLDLCQPGVMNKMVPLIVETCTRIVEEKGLENQGIYRVPGNSGAINCMLDELNKDPVTLCADNDKWQDVNVVSSLLKLFFRKLPESLITDELYQLVIKANQTENSERRMLKLKKLLHTLPEMNFETFHFLARHLAVVASKEEVNKMDARNLAIMFGPSLVRPNEDSMVAMVRDMSDQCRVVESIILHCEWFFSSWDEDVYVPVDEEADEATPISSMKSEMLAKAESLVNSSLHQVREGHKKDIFAGLLGTTRKKRRHRDKKGSASSVSEEDFVASKFGYNTNSSKTRSKGLSGNRSAENILQLEEETAVALEDDAASETVEVSFEVRKKYDMKEMNYFCIENEKRSIRRAKSNDSLLMQHRIVVRQPNRIPAQTQEKSQTLPSDRSTSQETLDDYASSGDTTTSDDGRNESRGSSILESEL